MSIGILTSGGDCPGLNAVIRAAVFTGSKLHGLEFVGFRNFERILTEPNASLTDQYQALMATEGVKIEFTQDGIRRLAEAAWQVNERTENIGARRLHTVMERLMEDISYDASEKSGETFVIDTDYVNAHLGALIEDEDLSRYIL